MLFVFKNKEYSLRKNISFIGVIGMLVLPSIAFTDIYRDQETNLAWKIIDKPATNWSDANKECQNLKDNENGYTNWYLPSFYELKSLVEYDKYSPAITSELKDIELGLYWSSSRYLGRKSHFWMVDFKSGKNDWGHEDDIHYVLCVHK